ncbi:unnamed protein product, partial [Meganyctiphanes norvegica]
ISMVQFLVFVCLLVSAAWEGQARPEVLTEPSERVSGVDLQPVAFTDIEETQLQESRIKRSSDNDLDDELLNRITRSADPDPQRGTHRGNDHRERRQKNRD